MDLPIVLAALLLLLLVACSEATGPSDGPAQAQDAAGDGAMSCPPGEHVHFLQAGCGAAARPLCTVAKQDACLAIVLYCGCDGQTVQGTCGGDSPVSYSAMGECSADAGTGTGS